ncbi:MAG TPA: cytochrome c3 family protein [Candidatus Deferrimicrobium sp.]|nr:cytochrome c3 family protein [Candidatus Deferrimicrobium sp.]
MTWKRWVLGTCLVLALVLIPGIAAMADTKVNLDELTKSRLAEAQKINEGCLKCHNQKTETTGRVPGQAPYIDPTVFGKSIHSTVPCTKCHDDVKEGTKPTNIVGGRELAKKVDKNCQKCHVEQTKVWENSTHGKLFQEGKDTALCTDCHGSHDILTKTNSESMVNGQKSVETCVKCHEHKYKETYEESFHGRSVFLGSSKSATCVSCHGSHSILGPEEPTSMVNKANISQTCAQCHLNASKGFSQGTEHAEMKGEGPGAVKYWTLKFFTWLTIIVFALLIVHIEIELWRRIQLLKKPKGGA